MPKKIKRSASSDVEVRSRIEASSKELKVVWYLTCTAAKFEGHGMYAVRMENEQVNVAWNREFTVCTAVVQLNAKSE